MARIYNFREKIRFYQKMPYIFIKWKYENISRKYLKIILSWFCYAIMNRIFFWYINEWNSNQFLQLLIVKNKIIWVTKSHPYERTTLSKNHYSVHSFTRMCTVKSKLKETLEVLVMTPLLLEIYTFQKWRRDSSNS